MNSLRTLLFATAVLLALALPASAQGTPNTRLAWDQTAPDLATAQGFSYKFYRDGVAVGTPLTGIICTVAVATSPVGTFPCSVGFPSSTPGVQHSIVLTASNTSGESLKSTAYIYTLIMLPAAPLNLRGL